MQLLSFFSLLGWIFFLGRTNRRAAAVTPLVAITALIALLYLAALLHILLPIDRLLLAGGFIALLWWLIRRLQGKRDINWQTITKAYHALPIGYTFLFLFGLWWYHTTKTPQFLAGTNFFGASLRK